MTKKRLILLELNEVNFNYIKKYVQNGLLNNFNNIINTYGVTETVSEEKYENIEPWIQWQSIHTGLKYEEHKIFRLGDVVEKNIPQIWETLEERGLSVSAISPMNAVNRLKKANYFIPDPWTKTKVSGNYLIQKLSMAISQIVNDNAQSKFKLGSIVFLMISILVYGRIKNYPKYILYLYQSIRKKWMRVIFLDRFLSDLHFCLWLKHRPDFCSIFLNGAAHLQHHYLFNSSAYDGENQNPEWYISRKYDPILEIYKLYDQLIGEMLSMKNPPRILIATGLHQDPYPTIKYYYRLKQHDEFIKILFIKFKSVSARMSRDFLVGFDSHSDAVEAANILEKVVDIDSNRVFTVDNRGISLFVTLSYPFLIKSDFTLVVNGKKYNNMERFFVFVAIKNGLHNGVGYYLDINDDSAGSQATFQVEKIHHEIIKHFS